MIIGPGSRSAVGSSKTRPPRTALQAPDQPDAARLAAAAAAKGTLAKGVMGTRWERGGLAGEPEPLGLKPAACAPFGAGGAP